MKVSLHYERLTLADGVFWLASASVRDKRLPVCAESRSLAKAKRAIRKQLATSGFRVRYNVGAIVCRNCYALIKGTQQVGHTRTFNGTSATIHKDASICARVLQGSKAK